MTDRQTAAPSQWMMQTKRADFTAIAENYHISPVTARIIRNRDVVETEEIERYLYGTISDLYSPDLLPDMEKTVKILKEKTESGKRIRVVGDYDIDGVCSTYILLTALKETGAFGDYRIPDRIKDGYGINEAIIQQAFEDGVDTILTCDNGIAAVEQIRMAKELGMTVIITDHHDIQKDGMGNDILPAADAVVNPKRSDSRYPYPEICGGMVAYKLMRALYEAFGIPLKKWEEMLEFAAIATVGDVMKLQDENRIVVKEGLKRIGQTRNLGLLSLIEKNNLNPKTLTAYHIGFVIGPCLNAGGRLQTAKTALKLLMAEDPVTADHLAGELKDLNEQRKDMTLKGTEEAIAQVEECFQDDRVLVVFLPDCHESLAGIVAGRLREKFQKPSFVLTRSEERPSDRGRFYPESLDRRSHAVRIHKRISDSGIRTVRTVWKRQRKAPVCPERLVCPECAGIGKEPQRSKAFPGNSWRICHGWNVFWRGGPFCRRTCRKAFHRYRVLSYSE